MANLVFTEAFVDDMVGVSLESKRREIMRRISLLADAPEIGSGIIPESIKRRYGKTVRKLVIPPFDVIYEHIEHENTAYILGLIHQRAAW